jgi:Zn-dependent protease
MWYALDSRRVTFQECRWSGSLPSAILVWSLRFIGVRVPGSFDDPCVDALEPFEKPVEEWPEEVRKRFESVVASQDQFAFADRVCYAIHDVTNSTWIYQMHSCHPSGQSIATIHFRSWELVYPKKEYLFPVFVSAFADGTFLVSTAGKPFLLSPPSCTVQRLVGASFAELWAAHQRRLAELRSEQKIVPVRDDEALRQVLERYHATVRAFHVERGFFVPLTAKQEAAADVKRESLEELESGGSEHAEVLAEVDRLQHATASWWNTLLVLGISLVMFAGAGAASWSSRFVLLLIPILFFHELGHFAAMRLFKYRNLRMFFIPFFGAAVAGQHYNVPGWKKAVVALLGPLPGIVVGIPLGICGIMFGQKLLIEAAVLMMILNGFNLLPLLPLDGGQVLHAILFVRHPLLDVAFRALAACLMIAGSLFSVLRFGWYIGLAMLLGLPLAYRMNRIAGRLRGHVPTTSPDDQSIPSETAEAILDELKTGLPANTTTKLRARYVLQVFELLNTRPPGWLATGSLIAVHVGSFVLAVVLAAVFVVAQHGDLRRLVQQAATMPKNVADRGTLRTWRGPRAPANGAWKPVTVIATFPKPSVAEQEFEQLSLHLPAASAATVFGQTILIEFPPNDDAGRARFVARLQERSAQVAVQTDKLSVPMTLVCFAPSAEAAEELAGEVNAYRNAAQSAHLIPPWSKSHSLTAEQHKARWTFHKLTDQRAPFNDPELRELRKGMSEQRDMAAARELMRRQQKRAEELRRKHIEEIRELGPDQVDLAVVDLYEQRPTMMVEPGKGAAERLKAERKLLEQWHAKLGKALGQLPTVGGRVQPGEDRYSTVWVHVEQNGLLLRFNSMTFVRPAEGSAAFLEWLGAHQCAGFKYEFEAPSEEDEE